MSGYAASYPANNHRERKLTFLHKASFTTASKLRNVSHRPQAWTNIYSSRSTIDIDYWYTQFGKDLLYVAQELDQPRLSRDFIQVDDHHTRIPFCICQNEPQWIPFKDHRWMQNRFERDRSKEPLCRNRNLAPEQCLQPCPSPPYSPKPPQTGLKILDIQTLPITHATNPSSLLTTSVRHHPIVTVSVPVKSSVHRARSRRKMDICLAHRLRHPSFYLRLDFRISASLCLIAQLMILSRIIRETRGKERLVQMIVQRWERVRLSREVKWPTSDYQSRLL